VEIIDAAGRFADPGESGAEYEEHLRRADLSVGTYSLRAGATDRQSPHAEAHRFHDITEDLAVLVFFGPAYGSRAT
jgi:hypothetical protein